VNFFGPETTPWFYAVGLLVMGFALLFLEVFVIPGINVFGILGVVAVVTGVAYAYFRLGPGAALSLGVWSAVGTAALLWAVLRHRAWQRLVLRSDTARREGYSAAPADLEDLVGQEGRALTPLRPSGRAQFGERIIDVVTEGNFIPRDARIEVLSVAGARVVVQQRPPEPAV